MKFYLVNTNKKLNPNEHDEQSMFDEQIVALYHDGKKEKIDQLKDGDIVFFYSNGKGIVACGEVWGKTYKRDYQNNSKYKDAEYYKKLKFLTKLSEPITIVQMKKMFGKRQTTMRAFIPMNNNNGLILYDAIHSTRHQNKAA